VNRSSAMDGGERFSLEQNRRAARLPRNPSHFCFLPPPPPPPERASERGGWRCDALIRELEPVNPRVDAGEPRVSFPDSDEVRSGDGLAQVSPEPLILMLGFLKFGDFLFLFNPVLIHS
jgi:hypothetical protein